MWKIFTRNMQNLIAMLRLTVYLTIIYYLKDRSVKLLSVEYMSTDWYQLYTLNSSVNSPINNKITKIINYF